MNFIHFTDAELLLHCICRNSFPEDENIEKPQVLFDAIGNKKGKSI
jgi:hypothetical protein